MYSRCFNFHSKFSQKEGCLVRPGDRATSFGLLLKRGKSGTQCHWRLLSSAVEKACNCSRSLLALPKNIQYILSNLVEERVNPKHPSILYPFHFSFFHFFAKFLSQYLIILHNHQIWYDKFFFCETEERPCYNLPF